MRQLIAGNWKMNGLRAEAVTLAQGIRAGAQGMASELLVCPPFTVIEAVAILVVLAASRARTIAAARTQSSAFVPSAEHA